MTMRRCPPYRTTCRCSTGGLHWTTSTPGSIDEFAWFKRVAEYTATLPNKSKFILSMPMYGIDWANGGGSGNPGTPLEFANIEALAAGMGIEPQWDATALSPHFSYTDSVGAHHEVWYTDKQSIGARTETGAHVGARGGAVASGRRGPGRMGTRIGRRRNVSIERLAVGPARARLRVPQRVWIVLVLALALGLAALPAVVGAAPSRKRVQAFLLTSSPDSLSDLEAHAGSVGVVYPTWFNCRIPSGRITGGTSSSIASYASTRHIALMPRFNCQDGATVHRLLTDPSLRAATLTRLTSIGTAGLVRGVCLDLENDGAEDREALNLFVSALAARLHARHRRLAVVVDGVERENGRISTGFYDDRALSAVADTVFVLAWGTHWEESAPAPIASLGYVNGVARYVASLPNASRFVLGAPMYGAGLVGRRRSGVAGQGSAVLRCAGARALGWCHSDTRPGLR